MFVIVGFHDINRASPYNVGAFYCGGGAYGDRLEEAALFETWEDVLPVLLAERESCQSCGAFDVVEVVDLSAVRQALLRLQANA